MFALFAQLTCGREEWAGVLGKCGWYTDVPYLLRLHVASTGVQNLRSRIVSLWRQTSLTIVRYQLCHVAFVLTSTLLSVMIHLSDTAVLAWVVTGRILHMASVGPVVFNWLHVSDSDYDDEAPTREMTINVRLLAS